MGIVVLQNVLDALSGKTLRNLVSIINRSSVSGDNTNTFIRSVRFLNIGCERCCCVSLSAT